MHNYKYVNNVNSLILLGVNKIFNMKYECLCLCQIIPHTTGTSYHIWLNIYHLVIFLCSWSLFMIINIYLLKNEHYIFLIFYNSLNLFHCNGWIYLTTHILKFSLSIWISFIWFLICTYCILNIDKSLHIFLNFYKKDS